MGLPALQFEMGSSVEEARTLAHEALDRWFDQVAPLFANGHEPTIGELSHRFGEPVAT